MLERITTAIVTDTNGAATVYLGSRLRGRLHVIIYRPSFLTTGEASPTPLATGADLTITAEQNPPSNPTGAAGTATVPAGTPILRKDNLGTGTSFLYPRAKPTISNDATGGLGTVPSELIPLVKERIKVVVAQGGNTATGCIEAIYDSEG